MNVLKRRRMLNASGKSYVIHKDGHMRCGDSFFADHYQKLVIPHPCNDFLDYMAEFFEVDYDTRTIHTKTFYNFKFAAKLYRYLRNDFTGELLNKIFHYYKEGYSPVEALILGHIDQMSQLNLNSSAAFTNAVIYNRQYLGTFDIFFIASHVLAPLPCSAKELVTKLNAKRQINNVLDNSHQCWYNTVVYFKEHGPKQTLKYISNE